jgi:hypothetical protein
MYYHKKKTWIASTTAVRVWASDAEKVSQIRR